MSQGQSIGAQEQEAIKIAMQRSLLDSQQNQEEIIGPEEQKAIETALQRSLLDSKRDPEAMCTHGIGILADRGVTAYPASIFIESFGDCLPDSLIAAQYPNIGREDLKWRSRKLRTQGTESANKKISSLPDDKIMLLQNMATGPSGPWGEVG